MAVNKPANFLDLAREGLEASIKKQLEDDFVTPLLEEFETRVRAVVRERLAEYTFTEIQRLEDLQEYQQKIHVKIHFSDEEAARDEV